MVIDGCLDATSNLNLKGNDSLRTVTSRVVVYVCLEKGKHKLLFT
jgi:hypothetical protein